MFTPTKRRDCPKAVQRRQATTHCAGPARDSWPHGLTAPGGPNPYHDLITSSKLGPGAFFRLDGRRACGFRSLGPQSSHIGIDGSLKITAVPNVRTLTIPKKSKSPGGITCVD